MNSMRLYAVTCISHEIVTSLPLPNTSGISCRGADLQVNQNWQRNGIIMNGEIEVCKDLTIAGYTNTMSNEDAQMCTQIFYLPHKLIFTHR